MPGQNPNQRSHSSSPAYAETAVFTKWPIRAMRNPGGEPTVGLMMNTTPDAGEDTLQGYQGLIRRRQSREIQT